MIDKPLPANPDAEAAVVGSILIDPRAYSAVSWLTEEMFSSHFYALAWRAVRECVHEGVTPDIVAVDTYMERLDAGMMAAEGHLLAQTVNSTPTSAHARHYGEMVVRSYQNRQIILAWQRAIQNAYNDVDPAATCQAGMMKLARIMAASPDENRAVQTTAQIIDTLNEDVLDRQVDALEHPTDRRLALLTGVPAVDKWTGGFDKGDLILLAGRPGQGKSALGLSLATRMAGRYHYMGEGSILYVSMEMSSLSLMRRMVGFEAGINTLDMRRGFVKTDEVDAETYRRFARGAQNIKDHVGDALLFYANVLTTDELSVIATEAYHNRGMRALFIDQLDLFADTCKEGEQQRTGNISRALKSLAMRLGIPIFCMAQLNREVERRSDKRPQLPDLRQSGRLEMDADVVLGIYRPVYYYDAPLKSPTAFSEWAEILTLKYRNGKATMMTPMRFVDGSYTDWPEDERPIRDMQELVSKTERGEW